jgi:L-ascorbate 6-phosphate lactonase
MIQSTWGTQFLRQEIESENVSGASVWYLGCNGFVLRDAETTLYIDPYFGAGEPPFTFRMIPVPLHPAEATQCDAVLVTHEHIDHFHPPSYGPLVENLGASLSAPAACFSDPSYDGALRAPADRRHEIDAGDTFNVGGFTVHVRAGEDADAIEPVVFIIEHDDGTFFHGGDTKPADRFHKIGEEFDIDLGILAFGTVGNIYYPDEDQARETRWYMDESQVIEVANTLQLDRLLPSHYDMWRGTTGDPKGLFEHAASFEYPHVIEPAKIGDRLSLAEPGIESPHLARQ